MTQGEIMIGQDHYQIQGFKMKYDLLCQNLRTTEIEQKEDVRVSLRSVNELLKTFDSLLMELDDVTTILYINIRTGKGEQMKRHNVSKHVCKYANELNVREDQLKNKEKEDLEIKKTERLKT